MRMLRLSFAIGSLFLFVSSSSAGIARGSEPMRLYMLHADSGFHYWSPDPGEPEASSLGFTRACGEYTGSICPQALPSGFVHLLPFLPGALPEGGLSWTPQAPLRFRFAMDVRSDVPYTVHALVIGGGVTESPPAVETSPGIWEGTIGGSGSAPPGTTLIFGMLVRQPTQARTGLEIDVRTAGASWFEMVPGGTVRSASELVGASNYRPEPTRLVTEERVLSFNDTDWETFSFEGDLSAERSMQIQLPRRAAIVMGWFESVSEPFTYGLTHGDTDARKPTEMGLVHLSSGEQELSAARYSASAVDVSPGTLTMRVEPQDGAESHPYTAHLVAIYGDRTLASYRWRFEVPAVQVRSPVAQAYQGPQQQIPSSPEVTTFSVSIAADSASPSPNEWAIGFDVPGFYAPEAGMSGTTTPLRVVAAGERLSRVTPTPASGSVMVSAWDTVFEGEVRYAYTPCREKEDGTLDCEDTP